MSLPSEFLPTTAPSALLNNTAICKIFSPAGTPKNVRGVRVNWYFPPPIAFIFTEASAVVNELTFTYFQLVGLVL